jgi:hypothetical protein
MPDALHGMILLLVAMQSYSLAPIVEDTTSGLLRTRAVSTRNSSIIVPAAIMPACHLLAWYMLTSAFALWYACLAYGC